MRNFYGTSFSNTNGVMFLVNFTPPAYDLLTRPAVLLYYIFFVSRAKHGTIFAVSYQILFQCIQRYQTMGTC
jgi:hypothetical protein